MKVTLEFVEQEFGGWQLLVDGVGRGAGTKAQVIRGARKFLEQNLDKKDA